MVRLVRIDPYLGFAEPAALWPKAPKAQNHWLLVDRDGQVVLVTTSKKQHAIARLNVVPFLPGGDAKVDALEVRDGQLAFTPLVDISGYTFVIRQGSKLVVERRDALGGAVASLAELESIL